ncbi:hypothetical protein TrST_g9744 [Triparma strigata]|uniref:EGF-like domain-containing protein n=1 Tax=Triparma strigata TaxID=1606541 RepID=A0A9W7EID4_9STRA|nr:hypothetical protein TrST_g9744 [Triparma strigata]
MSSTSSCSEPGRHTIEACKGPSDYEISGEKKRVMRKSAQGGLGGGTAACRFISLLVAISALLLTASGGLCAENSRALVVYDPSTQLVGPLAIDWPTCLALLYMSANLFMTAAFYVVNLMPRSFSYKLRLKNDSIRLLNVVVINAIIMQGAAAELFGGAKVGKVSMRLRSEQENANEGALALPVTELDGTSEQGGVRGMVSATALGGGRKLTEHQVQDLEGLFGKVSNRVESGFTTGNSLMTSGDTAVLGSMTEESLLLTCLVHVTSDCAKKEGTEQIMLFLDDLAGEIKCGDSNTCVLDGESTRRVMKILGTDNSKLTIKSLTFMNGEATVGGGIFIAEGAKVDLAHIIFSGCKATQDDLGGGAIYVASFVTDVNVYGTFFTGNIATSSNGNDIYNDPVVVTAGCDEYSEADCDDSDSDSDPATITIYNSCLSPYESNTPTQGQPLNYGGVVGGSLFSYLNCADVQHIVNDQTELFDKVSNGYYSYSWGLTNVGNSIMGHGETTVMAVANYQCSDSGDWRGECATDHNAERSIMLYPSALTGKIKCTNDDASCVLDGESTRTVMYVEGDIGRYTELTLRAITFKDGNGDDGGGIILANSAMVYLEICTFSRCKATSISTGGGAINAGSGSRVDVYGCTFFGNIATSQNGDDVYNNPYPDEATIEFHNTCPSPYDSSTPFQWTALSIHGTVGGTTNSFLCFTCPNGFSGTFPACTADPCWATSSITDDGLDGTNFYCINGGVVGGTTGSCTCTSCETGYSGPNCANPHNVATMSELFNKISNGQDRGLVKTGNSIMIPGNSVELAVGEYMCSDGGEDCYSTSWDMLVMTNLNGEVKCTVDIATCVIDGVSRERTLRVVGTDASKLSVRAITFRNGHAFNGAGLHISDGAMVDILICYFVSCHAGCDNANCGGGGGGAIYVDGSNGNPAPNTVNVYGTSFTYNTATIGEGQDIWLTNSGGPVITIHKTCPEPYNSNTPTIGSTLDTRGMDTVPFQNSYTDCVNTVSPTPSPTVATLQVDDMTGLYEKVSMYSYEDSRPTSFMDLGDTVELAAGEYKCSEGTCKADYAKYPSMIYAQFHYGTIRCVNDNASCYLNGENERRLIEWKSTNNMSVIGKLTFRGIHFKNGEAPKGGGLYIHGSNADVDVVLCVFSSCRANSVDGALGGGALYIDEMDNSPEGTNVLLNVYGTTFIGNTAATGDGDDIHNNCDSGCVIKIHDTCSSPYSSVTPIQGLALDLHGTVEGSAFSYALCTPSASPTPSPTHSPTPSPSEDVSDEGEEVEEETTTVKEELDGAASGIKGTGSAVLLATVMAAALL